MLNASHRSAEAKHGLRPCLFDFHSDVWICKHHFISVVAHQAFKCCIQGFLPVFQPGDGHGCSQTGRRQGMTRKRKNRRINAEQNAWSELLRETEIRKLQHNWCRTSAYERDFLTNCLAKLRKSKNLQNKSLSFMSQYNKKIMRGKS